MDQAPFLANHVRALARIAGIVLVEDEVDIVAGRLEAVLLELAPILVLDLSRIEPELVIPDVRNSATGELQRPL